MRILLTNDDGIDSVGLHLLAREMTRHGEVVIVAPDQEFSGASAAIGAIWEFVPHITRREVEGIDEAWAVNGPPALCVLYAGLGLFGEPFDLVVSGINPGANVGRAIYYSGTVGACLSGRNNGWPGIAVSQATSGWAGIEGQGWGDVLALQKWETAAKVAGAYVGGFVADPPAEPVIVNLNVPNLELDEIVGWRHTEVAHDAARMMSRAQMIPDTSRPGHFDVELEWGDKIDLPVHTDGGAVENGFVSITYLSRYLPESRDDLGVAEARLDDLLDLPGNR